MCGPRHFGFVVGERENTKILFNSSPSPIVIEKIFGPNTATMTDEGGDTDSFKSVPAPGDLAYKTETLRRGNEDMRRRISELRDTLQLERARVRGAHVDKVVAVKRQRDLDEVI